MSEATPRHNTVWCLLVSNPELRKGSAVKKIDEGCDNIWVSLRCSYCRTGRNILVAFTATESGQILCGD